MSLWFWADPHLGHGSINLHCGRPWATVEEADEALIANYRSCVSNRDEVIIAGDLAWKDHTKYIARLPGKKTFVFGNHDKMPDVAVQNFTRVVGRKNEPGILHMTVDKIFVVVCHFPLLSWNALCRGSWHFHGHCHGRLTEAPDCLRTDIGVDSHNYFPVAWEVLKARMLEREARWKETRKEGV